MQVDAHDIKDRALGDGFTHHHAAICICIANKSG